MSEDINMDELLDRQEQLMEKVPHGVRDGVFTKMVVSTKIMESLLEYLGSCGHKPWRPNPLSIEIQFERLAAVRTHLNTLYALHVLPVSDAYTFLEEDTRRLISGFGIIEETLEYLDAVKKGDEPNQLEEITDILFFYLEQVILSGFTWQQIVSQYVRKHAINLKRYEDAKQGDYSWDRRGEGRGL